MSNPSQITLENSIDITVFDLVIYENRLHAIGDNELYQCSLKPIDMNEIIPLSSLSY